MTRDRGRQRGIALLLVMWVFMILGVLALDFARYIRDDAMAAVNFAEETRGYYLALAGINRAIFDAERANEQARPGTPPVVQPGRGPNPPSDQDDDDQVLVPPDGEWHEGELGGGRFSVRMVDEAGRIPLNRVREPLLTRVVSNVFQGGNATTGLNKRELDAIATIVDAILDWRDGDDLVRNHGAESDYYLGLRPPYRAKNGRFDSPEELIQVRGMNANLFYGNPEFPGLRDLFSVYSRELAVNIRSTTAPVLQALLGIDAETAESMIAQRDTDAEGVLLKANAQLAGIDPTLPSFFVNLPPRTVMIDARADMQDERNRSRVAAVVELSSDDTEGAKVLRWLDRAPWVGTLPGTARHGGEAS